VAIPLQTIPQIAADHAANNQPLIQFLDCPLNIHQKSIKIHPSPKYII
jgi:hypothetical protein